MCFLLKLKNKISVWENKVKEKSILYLLENKFDYKFFSSYNKWYDLVFIKIL